MKIRIIELFGGIGACTKALERIGIDVEIADYVEIDKYAVKSYNAIHGTNFEPQNIIEWNKDIEADIIMHGSPCQDISLAGAQAGADEGSGTRSSLMFETIRIVDKVRPKYVIWENVKNLISKKHIHNFKSYIERMEELGYTSYYQVLNAKDYEIPQNRERVFTISIRKDVDHNFKFPAKKELKIKLKDLLEENVDEKYYLSDKMVDYIKADNDKWSENNGEALVNKTIASTINTGEGQRRCDASNYMSDKLPENYDLKMLVRNNTKQGYLEAHDGDGVYINRIDKKRGTVQQGKIQTLSCQPQNDLGVIVKEKNNLQIRKLTPKECWRLMGFDDSDYEKASAVNSDTQLYKQAGNSIVVNVLEGILTNLLKDGNE